MAEIYDPGGIRTRAARLISLYHNFRAKEKFSLTLFDYFRLLSSLPVAHLSDALRRRLVVTGDSARIQDETTEHSVWFFSVLGVEHRHTGPRFNVSSERLLIIFSWPAGDSNPQPVETRNIVFTSPTLYLLS